MLEKIPTFSHPHLMPAKAEAKEDLCFLPTPPPTASPSSSLTSLPATTRSCTPPPVVNARSWPELVRPHKTFSWYPLPIGFAGIPNKDEDEDESSATTLGGGTGGAAASSTGLLFLQTVLSWPATRTITRLLAWESPALSFLSMIGLMTMVAVASAIRGPGDDPMLLGVTLMHMTGLAFWTVTICQNPTGRALLDVFPTDNKAVLSQLHAVIEEYDPGYDMTITGALHCLLAEISLGPILVLVTFIAPRIIKHHKHTIHHFINYITSSFK